MYKKICEKEYNFLIWIQNHRTKTLNIFFRVITHSCDFGTIWILAALIMIFSKKYSRNDFKNYKSKNGFFFSVGTFKCFICGGGYFSLVTSDKYFVWHCVGYFGDFYSFFKALCGCSLSK